jgi:hypothetical protein
MVRVDKGNKLFPPFTYFRPTAFDLVFPGEMKAQTL